MSSILSLVSTIGAAHFSSDEAMTYRYRLSREWDADLPIVNFIGLNPSTADALRDDPTIRRCIGFARRWGFGKLVMTNLFAYRATDPLALCRAEADVVGPENAIFLEESAAEASMVIAAWGAVDGLFRNSVRFALRQTESVRQRLANGELYAIGFTQRGYPRHPLYVKGDTQPVLWPRGRQ